MVMVFVLDASFDSVDKNDDPFKTLDKTLNRQKLVMQSVIDTEKRVKAEKNAFTKDEIIKSEIEKIYGELRALAKDDLLDCVGEVMDEAELKVASVGVFERIMKIFMSLMMVISVY